MKVINLSLDPQLLNIEGVAANRNRLYGELVDKYIIMVHGEEDSKVELSQNVVVYCVSGLYKFIRLIRMYIKAQKLIIEHRCDVITSQDPYFLGFIAYVLAKRHHLGFELHILGIEKLSWLRGCLAKFLLQRAGSVRTNSIKLKDRLIREFKVPNQRILMIPIYIPVETLGFDTKLGSQYALSQVRLKNDFREHYGDRFNFVTVSRLVAIKNISMQFRAVELLRNSFPKIILHVVGGGPLDSILNKEIKDYQLHEHVVFHGRKEGIALGVFYTEGDCFLLTSLDEGWPMVVFEAASANLPVIMTNVGCAGEFIKDGETGLVVPINDAKVLSNAMKRVMIDDNLRKRIAANAYRALKEYWTLDDILTGYKKSWEKALFNRF